MDWLDWVYVCDLRWAEERRRVSGAEAYAQMRRSQFRLIMGEGD